MAKQTITPGKAPIVWSTVEDAFTKINANFTELYASVGGTGIEFDALESSLVPAQNDTYDLGSPNKRWASLYLSDTLLIGGAAITNEGLTINVPSGTTVAGQLVIDPNKAFFKEFSVNSETSIVADQFNDVLDFNAGTGIQLTVTSTNDQINITNIGVTSLVAGTAMAVSSLGAKPIFADCDYNNFSIDLERNTAVQHNVDMDDTTIFACLIILKSTKREFDSHVISIFLSLNHDKHFPKYCLSSAVLGGSMHRAVLPLNSSFSSNVSNTFSIYSYSIKSGLPLKSPRRI